MSSDLQASLEFIQLNNYASVVLVTAVTYDYVLVFSREVEYIWCRPWSWVSIAFVLVRYVGLCCAILNGLVGSPFIPGPQTIHRCTTLYLVIYWGFPIFLGAADLVMILRVYAMWGRSKWILSVLLFIYIPQIVASFILAGIFYNPNTYFSVKVDSVADLSFCDGWAEIPSPLLFGISIPRFVLGVALLVLVVISNLKQSVEMYNATKLWQPNKCMQQLVREGILYFIVTMLFHIRTVAMFGRPMSATANIFLSLFSFLSIFPIVPRFIIGVRELYDHENMANKQDVDTGFGFSVEPPSKNTDIMFIDITAGNTQAIEDDGDELETMIRAKSWGGNDRQV